MERTFTFLQRSRGSLFRRRRRVLSDRTSVYHVISRTARKRFWLGEPEREMLCRMLRKQAAFAGIEVLAFCVMSNHFHLLLRVPEKPLRSDGQHLIPDEEILRRYTAFYGDTIPRSTFSVAELQAAFDEGGQIAEEARRIVLARMGDLSVFVKELKQRFGIWFNDRHDNLGTIWSDRFKSILVENSAAVMSRVAAYIDLNPVRAEMVADPKDYSWSSFGAAQGGSNSARASLCALFGADPSEFKAIFRRYRSILYGSVEQPIRANDKVQAHQIESGENPEASQTRDKIPLTEALRGRISDFTETTALGSESFLQTCRSALSQSPKFRAKAWLGWQRFSNKIGD